MEKYTPYDSRLKVAFAIADRFGSKTGGAVEKDVSGKKRKYLLGIASGTDRDAHGERMSEKCIKSFMDQAEKGDILLYPDVHGIKQSEDVGILEKGYIDPQGDWRVEFRLYDQDDGIGPNKMERINDIWKQLQGVPPYSKPLEKGFSVEGIIPETATYMDSSGTKVLDDVVLDGVCLVGRPAYQKAMVQRSVEKSLSGRTSGRAKQEAAREIAKGLMGETPVVIPGYYHRRMALDDQLDSVLAKVAAAGGQPIDIEDQLKEIVRVWGERLITLVMESLDEVKGFSEGEDTGKAYSAEPVEAQAEKMEMLTKSIGEITTLIGAFATKYKEKKSNGKY